MKSTSTAGLHEAGASGDRNSGVSEKSVGRGQTVVMTTGRDNSGVVGSAMERDGKLSGSAMSGDLSHSIAGARASKGHGAR